MNTPAPDPAGSGPATPGGDEAAAASPAVTPFWQRMPLLFAFPLQRPALLRNVAATGRPELIKQAMKQLVPEYQPFKD